MQYFIGIVPPVEYQQQIIEFQKRWISNILPEVVEPHVTVKAQGGLSTELAWVDKVKNMCSNFPSFQLSIMEPRSFGDSVLYLGVESSEIFELHKRLVSVISPSKELIQRYFELDLYTPHLTLGQTYWGMSETELKEMKSEASNALNPFPTYTVKHVRIYREIEQNQYEPYQDIQLA